MGAKKSGSPRHRRQWAGDLPSGSPSGGNWFGGSSGFARADAPHRETGGWPVPRSVVSATVLGMPPNRQHRARPGSDVLLQSPSLPGRPQGRSSAWRACGLHPGGRRFAPAGLQWTPFPLTRRMGQVIADKTCLSTGQPQGNPGGGVSVKRLRERRVTYGTYPCASARA